MHYDETKLTYIDDKLSKLPEIINKTYVKSLISAVMDTAYLQGFDEGYAHAKEIYTDVSTDRHMDAIIDKNGT